MNAVLVHLRIRHYNLVKDENLLMMQSSSDFTRVLQIIVKSQKAKLMLQRKRKVSLTFAGGMNNFMKSNAQTRYCDYED